MSQLPQGTAAPVSNDKTRVQGIQSPPSSAPRRKRKRGKIRTSTVVKQVIFNGLKAAFVMFCIGLIVGSIVAVQVVQYVVRETQNDDNMLDLENIQLNQTSYILALNPNNENAKAQNDWVEYQELVGPEHRIWVTLDKIPQALVDAVVSTEDREFYDHHGVNFRRTAYALANEFFQFQDQQFGASTIDQQLVKNLTGDGMDGVGEEDDRSSGYERKLREIFRAWGLNNRYSKDMIMEAYLNTMGLSENIAGVQAGALEYFSKDVQDLSIAQCATIAGITKAPGSYSPYRNPERCLARRNDVLFFMRETEAITEEEYITALAEPLGVTRRSATQSNQSTTVFSYFTDKVFEDVLKDLMDKFGYTRSEALNKIYTGGLRIYATVDLDVQTALEEIYLDGYEEGGYFMDESRFPGYVQRLTRTKEVKDEYGNVIGEEQVLPQSSCAIINYDGELCGVIGGIGEKTESLSLNRAVGTLRHDPVTGELILDEYGNPIVEGTLRQVGSTMKPISAYALGIDLGILTYGFTLEDAPVMAATPGGPVDWPRNYNYKYRNYGVPVCSAIAESINTCAVLAGKFVGEEQMMDFMQNTLQVSSLMYPNDVALAPLVLGSMTYGMSAYELAGAYMMFGGNETYGVFNTLHSYIKVTDAKGNIVLEPDRLSQQAIQPQSGYIMNRMLSNVVHGQGMPAGAVPTAYGMYPVSEKEEGVMDSVAKTGTTSDDRDRWIVGLTPYYVTAVWWGYDEEFDFQTPYTWSPSAYTNVTANVWKSVMESVQEDLPYKDFPEVPDGIQQQRFCTISGGLAVGGCPSYTGYFADFAMPSACPGHPDKEEGEEGAEG